MEANNKREFFQLLTAELNRVGIDDTAEITADFEEHFANSAANGLSEAEACHRLGDIKEIARNYLNLESSRINSMVARDVERKRISLTKPGHSVPADLSLMNARDAANSDNVRSYTPEHISPEIYPNQSDSVPNSANNMNGGYNSNPQNVNFGGQSANTNNTSGANPRAGAASQTAANQSVADALSGAGKAIADAAKVTGHALADAFSNSGVKDAVKSAGKSAANAVKTAGHSAADAVSRAKSEHEQRQNQNQHQNRQSHDVPRPNDEFRENNSQNHTGTIPKQTGKAKNTKGGFKLVDVSMLKPNVNTSKLVGAILLDLFVWIWVIPTIAAIVISLVAAAAQCVFYKGLGGQFGYYNVPFVTGIFLFLGYVSLGVALVCVAVWIAKLLARLVVFIINMHIKAIYDL